MRGRQSETPTDKRWGQIHAQRRTQEIIGVVVMIKDRIFVENQIGEHGVPREPIVGAEEEVIFAADQAQS